MGLKPTIADRLRAFELCKNFNSETRTMKIGKEEVPAPANFQEIARYADILTAWASRDEGAS